MSGCSDTIDPLSQRLTFRSDLVTRGESFGGRLGFVIEDPLHGKFYQVGAAEFRFLKLCDGRQTLQETLARFASTAGAAAFSEAEALTLVRWATQRQLLTTRKGLSLADNREASGSEGARAFNPFFIRIPLGSPQRWLKPWYSILSGLFSASGAALFVVVWIGLAAYVLPRAQEILRWDTLWHPNNWLGLLAIWLGLKFWHELGHAVACQRYGGQVRSAGIALMCFAPVAYVDVTSAWRISSKWRRMIVSVAGMYFEGWAAALALALAAVCQDEMLRTWASHVALVAGGQTLLVNANPLVRFDGYYMLGDFLEIPNLHATSRQSAWNLFRRWSGDTQAIDSPLVGKQGMVAVLYASGAASGWRVVLVLAGVGFILTQQSILGPTLAWLLALAWVGLPLCMLRRELAQFRNWKPRKTRLLLGGISLMLLLVSGCAWLLQPAMVQTQGIVEFSPVTVVRAPVPGFVAQVLVRNGDHLPEGTPILVLKNEDLELEANELRLKVLQSKALIQSLAAQQQLAKRSNEEAKCRALETKLHEVQGQLDALTVRAPHAGHIIARELEQLGGQFLAAGTEVAVLGGEDTLHVLAVVPQGDWKAVRERGQTAEIVLESSTQRLASQAVRFQPAAHSTLPHEALSGLNGGPIAVRESSTPTTGGQPAYEPLAPIFVAHVQLPSGQLTKIYTGERAAVRFACPGYCRAARLWDLACQWFRQT